MTLLQVALHLLELLIGQLHLLGLCRKRLDFCLTLPQLGLKFPYLGVESIILFGASSFTLLQLGLNFPDLRVENLALLGASCLTSLQLGLQFPYLSFEGFGLLGTLKLHYLGSDSDLRIENLALHLPC